MKNNHRIQYLSPNLENYGRNYGSQQPQKSTLSNTKDSFVKITDFLSKLVQPKSQINENLNQTNLCLYQIQNNQMYFGRLDNDGRPQGLGIIIVDEWPVCYGMFESGELNGLAHVQENPFMILDGIFCKSNMKNGWVLDLKQKLTSFGKANGDDNKFQLMQQNSGVDYKKIESFRAKNHLKSPIFNNNYAYEIDPFELWPAKYLKIIKYEHNFDGINNFSPSYISEISRVAQLSSNRFQKDLIELIREHNEQKQSYEKVSKILQSRLKNYESQSKQKSRSNSKYRLMQKISRKHSPKNNISKKSLYFEGRNKTPTNKKNQLLNLDRLYSKHLAK